MQPNPRENISTAECVKCNVRCNKQFISTVSLRNSGENFTFVAEMFPTASTRCVAPLLTAGMTLCCPTRYRPLIVVRRVEFTADRLALPVCVRLCEFHKVQSETRKEFSAQSKNVG